MKRHVFTRQAILFALAALCFIPTPASFSAATSAAFVQSSNIGVNGFYSTDKAQRGRMTQAAIVMDIPQGYHVNANRPLGKYAVPTTVNIDAARGVQVSAISFPRAVVRTLKFSQGERLAVYEGRAIMRFNVTVPANFPEGVTEISAKVRFQACSNEVCYPPATRDIRLPIGVVGANDSVKRINTNIFGGGGGRRR
jgi:DsbC/DsbD-like thiol-disulfide interchange protein